MNRAHDLIWLPRNKRVTRLIVKINLFTCYNIKTTGSKRLINHERTRWKHLLNLLNLKFYFCQEWLFIGYFFFHSLHCNPDRNIVKWFLIFLKWGHAIRVTEVGSQIVPSQTNSQIMTNINKTIGTGQCSKRDYRYISTWVCNWRV